MMTTDVEEDVREAGQALLAAIAAQNGRVIDDLVVTADDFAEPVQGLIFEAAVRLHKANKPVDMITLANAVEPRYRPHVAALAEFSHLAYNVDAWAGIVEHYGTRRRLADAATRILALDPQSTSAELVDSAQSIIGSVSAKSVRPQYRFVRDMLDDVLATVADGGTAIPTPWRSLDKGIGGFAPGRVYVVAARPAVGKSVVAAQMATALAAHGAVAFSSLEMSASELVQRFISERVEVSARNLQRNRLTDRDIGRIANSRDALMSLNIAIDDRTNITPADVRAFVRDLGRRQKVAGVVVDYLQLMSSKSRADRTQQVAEFSRQMKIIAKEFEIPVIVLSQLNRDSEKRLDKRPIVADLRESGAIEQDADVIMLLRREGEQPNEQLIIDVAKQRGGETGDVVLDWQGYFSRAVDFD